MMILKSMNLLLLTHLFYAIDATNDVPDLGFGGNLNDPTENDDIDYLNQLAEYIDKSSTVEILNITVLSNILAPPS